MDEITLTEAGWAWKVQSFTFWSSGSSKFIAYTKNSNICHRLNFHRNSIFFFEMLVTMSSITINNNWNYQKLPKTANLKSTIPLRYSSPHVNRQYLRDSSPYCNRQYSWHRSSYYNSQYLAQFPLRIIIASTNNARLKSGKRTEAKKRGLNMKSKAGTKKPRRQDGQNV